AAGGRRSPNHLSQHRCDLLAAAGKGAEYDGQQHLQRLALRGRLARQIAAIVADKESGIAMRRNFRRLAVAAGLLGALLLPHLAVAQKQGGVLKVYFFDSPASMSIHEEATIAGQGPMMGVFNNLVMYKQDVPQSGFDSIVPDLASDWSWDEDKTQLSFRLREGIK